MKWSITTLGLAATTTVLAIPQAARPDLEPKGTAPAGCKRTFEGDFRISVLRLNGNKKVSDGIAPPEIGNFTNPALGKREAADEVLVNLNNGILKDRHGRTGAIVANRQFQFDGPPQHGSIYTAGWHICGNNSMAIGSRVLFYICASSDFFNLYDRKIASYCEPVEMIATPKTGAQPEVQSPGTAALMPVPVCQIGDGQPQVHTKPCGREGPPIPFNTPVPVPSGQVPPPDAPPIKTLTPFVPGVSTTAVEITTSSTETTTSTTFTRSTDTTTSTTSTTPTTSTTFIASITETASIRTTSIVPIFQITTSGPIQVGNRTNTTIPVITAAAAHSLPQLVGTFMAAGAAVVFLL